MKTIFTAFLISLTARSLYRHLDFQCDFKQGAKIFIGLLT